LTQVIDVGAGPASPSLLMIKPSIARRHCLYISDDYSICRAIMKPLPLADLRL
jgi:hypothetical protein